MSKNAMGMVFLDDVRKMNCLQRENTKSIDLMRDQIAFYEDFLESVDLNKNKHNDQSVLREIRANLFQLSILSNPELAAMYRSGTLFTFNFPLLIDHIRREAIFFVEQLQRLQRREQVNLIQEIIAEKAFWDQIMKEHAQFIAHLLDPTEVALIDTADDFADLFTLLQARVQKVEESIIARLFLGGLIREETRATREIRDFKATATEGLLACQIKSIIIPLLGDHVLREANHFLRILTNPRSLL